MKISQLETVRYFGPWLVESPVIRAYCEKYDRELPSKLTHSFPMHLFSTP